MGRRLSIDFGTTNTVVACWDEAGRAEVIHLGQLSADTRDGRPPLIPSLLYVQDGGQVKAGQQVPNEDLDLQSDNRLFRNFKRGIVGASTPEPRWIDGALWGDREAGRSFLRQVIQALPFPPEDIEQLVLTAPVASFESYLAWLNEVMDEITPDKVHIVDESTAAALGYTITKPGATVLIFDFGGGTLDLSLVQLPENRERAGGILRRILKGNPAQHSARVIAKAGRIIGGSDIDQWLLADVLKRTGLTTQTLGSGYARLLTLCERIKVELSSAESAQLQFETAGRAFDLTITRSELEALLEANGFYATLRRVVDKVMHVAHQRGIFKEDIHHVLMVGGTSQMPSVQRTLGQYFRETAIYGDKPFTSVAEGALQLTAGYGLEDYLAHSYGIRHLDPVCSEHRYDEIIPMGTPYPTSQPVEVLLGAAHPDQREVEFVIGEIDSDSAALIEVRYENGQAMFVAQADSGSQQIVPLNEEQASSLLARLNPPGVPGEDRLKAAFSVDARRQLKVTVSDVKTGRLLLDDVVVTTLR